MATKNFRSLSYREKINTKYIDASSGKTYNLIHLQEKMKKANATLRRAKTYLSNKEYRRLEESYEKNLAMTGLFKPGTTRYSLSAMKKINPTKLMSADAAVQSALNSAYMSKTRHKEIDTKRYQSYLNKGYVKSKEQYEMLRDLFASEAWKELNESRYMNSDTLVQIFKQQVWAQGSASDVDIQKKIQDVLQKYADASKLHETWKQTPLGRFTPTKKTAEVSFSNNSEWDDLVNESYDADAELVDIANIKTSAEFQQRLANDLIDIFRGF